MLKGSVQTAQLWRNVLADLRLSNIGHFAIWWPCACVEAVELTTGPFVISNSYKLWCPPLSLGSNSVMNYHVRLQSGIGHIRECIMHAWQSNKIWNYSLDQKKNKKKVLQRRNLERHIQNTFEYSDNTFIWRWMFAMFVKELIMSNHQIWLKRMPIGLNLNTSKVFPTYISQYSICYPVAWEQLETHRKYLITYKHISSQTTVG